MVEKRGKIALAMILRFCFLTKIENRRNYGNY